jgi:hypothetical protein
LQGQFDKLVLLFILILLGSVVIVTKEQWAQIAFSTTLGGLLGLITGRIGQHRRSDEHIV